MTNIRIQLPSAWGSDACRLGTVRKITVGAHAAICCAEGADRKRRAAGQASAKGTWGPSGHLPAQVSVARICR